MTGYRASGVPGTVRGLEYASQKVREEAVGGAGAARRWSWRPRASRCPTRRRNRCAMRARAGPISGVEPHLPARRQVLRSRARLFVQPDLARTLERIARLGAEGFLRRRDGAPAGQGHGRRTAALITLADLKDYAVHRAQAAHRQLSRATTSSPRRRPVRAASAFCRCWACWKAPGYEKAGAGSASAVHYMTEAMRRYFADRVGAHGRSRFRQGADGGAARPRLTSRRLRASIDPERATPSSRAARRRCSPDTNPNETTHYTVADAEGNVAAVTYTLERRLRQQGDGHRARASC